MMQRHFQLEDLACTKDFTRLDRTQHVERLAVHKSLRCQRIDYPRVSSSGATNTGEYNRNAVLVVFESTDQPDDSNKQSNL